ncbi:hypothetical protein DCC85_04600 [Paenibacillus sp. CAA11]|uniref:hypothetical protein n=1 Tax=Paenibacillus sp. CAA11 TaxID=1532905 RepID=UPI000D3B1561|nr:hypothetical protein [Paenibacillus sp. CAA11]AWB43573.1 hypothetical protein DCC85_04600 [Paenibacillus sp. CAA11]
MMDQERVLVKHAVTGRMLLDSRRDGLAFEIIRSESGTLVRISDVTPDQAEEVLCLREELNVFHFEEPNEGPVTKHWFYVKSGKVMYGREQHQLRIYTEGELVYNPQDYWE